MTIRLILADDHQIMRQGLREMLLKVPDVAVIAEAEDGRTAVKLVQDLNPDVVVIDVTMPDMNGIEATRQITTNSPPPRVIALSMHADRRFVNGMLSAGASGYLLKGVAAGDLVRAIKAVRDGAPFVDPAIAAKLVEDYVHRVRGELPDDPGDLLTPREQEILKLVAEGHSNHDVAAQLYLSKKTVETHRANIMRKLDLHDVTELIKYALRRGIIHLD